MSTTNKWKYPLLKAVVAACLIICVDLGFAACSNSTEKVTLIPSEAEDSISGSIDAGRSVSSDNSAGESDTLAASETGSAAAGTADDLTGSAAAGTADALTGSGEDGTGAGASAKSGAEDSDTAGQTQMIYVFVCGEVENPGVYELPEGTRVYEALAAAGGLSLNADASAVNQALVLSDQDQLYIPAVNEEGGGITPGAEGKQSAGLSVSVTSSGSGTEEGGTAAGGLVNINTADTAALETLPGIGSTKAAAIVAYRSSNGAFRSTEDLKNVSGIGDATFDKLKDRITVD